MLHRPVLSVLSPFCDHQINLHLHSHLIHRLPLLHRPPIQLSLPPFPRLVRILLSLHTDQGILVLPTSQLRDLLLWLSILQRRTPCPVTQILTVSVRIDLQLICTRKTVNYLTIMTCPLPTPSNPSRRNSLIEKR